MVASELGKDAAGVIVGNGEAFAEMAATRLEEVSSL